MVCLCVLGPILLLQFIHLAVLRGVTSKACYVDCEKYSSFVIFEIEHIIRQSVHFELEEFISILSVHGSNTLRIFIRIRRKYGSYPRNKEEPFRMFRWPLHGG